ncbi:2-phospho-L-lactate guanylyltransferase [Kineosphaera limosa]|nr:2-phospho-L-lactate guanylyltransferase [Kineosphaera limosa]
MTAEQAPRWTVIVPVKGTAAAKTRLVAGLGPLLSAGAAGPQDLARALALDTLAAVAATAAVRLLVVTADPGLTGAATVVPDPGRGLDAAIAAGLNAAAGEAPQTPAAVLLSDLPALRPQDLSAALTACLAAFAPAARRGRSAAAFVPDAEGSGTVLLAGAQPSALQPAFGVDSAARHAQHAQRLELPLPALRRDVDTVADLAQAVALGVGAHTAAALAGLLVGTRVGRGRPEGAHPALDDALGELLRRGSPS